MATADEYAAWIVKNADKKGTPAFDTVAAAYKDARSAAPAATESGIPKGRGGVSQIPVEPGANITPTQEQPSSLLGEIRGGLETIPALASGAVSGFVSPIAGVLGSLAQGKGAKEGERIAGQVSQAMTYQPRTPEAQRNVQAVGNAMAPLVGVPIPTMNMLAQSAPAAIRAVGDAARSEGNLIKGAVQAPLQARATRIQEGQIAQSYANAPVIDAAKAAERLGFAVNPAITNPTLGNRAKGMVVGPAFNEAALPYNAAKATEVVRKDLGIAANKPLDKTAVETALDVASKPADFIRTIPKMEPSGKVITAIKSVEKPALIGGKAEASAVRAVIGEALDDLANGPSGSTVLDSIRQLRRQAQGVYKARDKGINVPPAADIAGADARMGIADALEQMIDEHAPNAQVISDLRESRVRQAQIYDQERAINYANETVDPQIFAKLLDEKKGGMTGVGADIGKVAAKFPDVMSTQAPTAQLMAKATRSGVLSAAGALAGGMVAGYPGAIGGASAGGAIGIIGNRLAARGMINPAYQTSRAMPADYRPVPSGLRPVEPGVPTNALVPYDYSQQAFTPPNFVLQPNQYAPRVTPGMPQGGPAALPAPSAAATLGALRTEDIRRAGVSRTLGTQAEQQAAAQAAASRKPASGEVILDYDPITGRFKEASQGLKGATPETFSNFGSALETASTKVTSGQRFSMTAAEKVAWDKTKVDLAEVAPGFKSLTDKAIAEKMMDRVWVEETVAKARQKAQAFENIAARAADERARQTALANRERMLSLVEDMEKQLGNPRPVRGTQQGPKTRAVIRNALAPEQQSQNALAP